MVLCWVFYALTPNIFDLFGKKHFSAEEKKTHVRGMTVYYWTLVIGQIAAAVSTTTKSQRVFGPGGYGLPNHTLSLLILLEIALGLAVMYVPILSKTFSTGPLT